MSFIVLAVLAFAGIFALLSWREKKRAARNEPSVSVIRLLFGAIALLTMLFTGGCGLFFLGDWFANGMRSNDYVSVELIAVLTLPPLLSGVFVWWLSMRRPAVPPPPKTLPDN